MGKYTGSFFDNPYIENGEHAPSVELIMDEARQKWRTGVWKPKDGSFAIDRTQIAGDGEDKNAPPDSRFDLDINRDLMGGGISLDSLRELSYSPSYRPKGTLDKLNEDTFVKMSTLQRYDVLAGELESPPDDISFLTNAQKRHEKDVLRSGKKKDGSLRLDTRRLEQSVDERRSEILRLLPSANDDDTTRIIDESKRRKAREDRELGRVTDDSDTEASRLTALAAKDEADDKKRRKGYLANVSRGFEEDDAEIHMVGERFDRLPSQDGMFDANAPKRELPEFESQSRHWSRIHSQRPTWSEVAAQTESSSPGDPENAEHAPRYIDDHLFNENRPYEQIMQPRKRLRSTESGHFDNEYIREAGLDPVRIQEIMNTNYRGRWVPPEFFSDNDMVEQWFNQYERGSLSDEDYLRWAYQQKMMEQQQRIAEQEAMYAAAEAEREANRRPTYHSNSRGRRYSPFAHEDGDYMPSDPRLLAEQYAAARREGFSRGAAINRREQMREREEREAARYYAGYYDEPYDDGYDDSRYDDRRYDRRYDDRRYDDRRYDDRYDVRRYGSPYDDDAPPEPVYPRRKRR